MSVPCNITFKFGRDLPPDITPDAVITDELQSRIQRLLTGQFVMDGTRCIIDVDSPWNPAIEVRDSVCVGANLGPISISYCRDL